MCWFSFSVTFPQHTEMSKLLTGCLRGEGAISLSDGEQVLSLLVGDGEGGEQREDGLTRQAHQRDVSVHLNNGGAFALVHRHSSVQPFPAIEHILMVKLYYWTIKYII